MPMIGIKSKGSEFNAATISVDRVQRSTVPIHGPCVRLFCRNEYIGLIWPDEVAPDDDLDELLRVYDAAQVKEK